MSYVNAGPITLTDTQTHDSPNDAITTVDLDNLVAEFDIALDTDYTSLYCYIGTVAGPDTLILRIKPDGTNLNFTFTEKYNYTDTALFTDSATAYTTGSVVTVKITHDAVNLYSVFVDDVLVDSATHSNDLTMGDGVFHLGYFGAGTSVTTNINVTAAAVPTTIDDITFDVPEWIGLPAGDHLLEAEDDGGTASLLVAYELPAGWVQQVSDGTGAATASSLAKQVLDSHGITVVSGDYYATNGNTVGADGVPPNDTAFNFRVLDTSAGQWTTEVAYVPALRIDSATAGPLQEGDTLTITHSNASASGKTYTIGGLAVTADSQNASTSVLTIPDLKSHGAKTNLYNTDLTITVTDGAQAASIIRQVEPVTGDYYATLQSRTGAFSSTNYPNLAVGDRLYVEQTGGSTVHAPDVAVGAFPEGTTWNVWINDQSDDVWGTVGTLVVPSITPGGDVTKPIITLLGSATVAHAQQAPYTDAGATATDETDGTLTNDIVVSGDTVDVNTVGSYVIRYNVSDAAGNAATEVTRTVDVLADPIPPVITVTGSTSIQLVLDATYTELGATWTDNVDGAGAATVGGDTVDTSTAGTYVVTYNHTDEAGNPATQRTRTVKIGGAVSTLIVSDFPATEVVTANDLQQPLIKLHQLCRRSSAEVARQIEAHIHTLYFLMPGTAIGTAPDATPAATVKLKALYSAFTGFDRAWRIKATRVRRLSDNVAVQAAIAAQLQFWLTKQGWTFA